MPGQKCQSHYCYHTFFNGFVRWTWVSHFPRSAFSTYSWRESLQVNCTFYFVVCVLFLSLNHNIKSLMKTLRTVIHQENLLTGPIPLFVLYSTRFLLCQPVGIVRALEVVGCQQLMMHVLSVAFVVSSWNWTCHFIRCWWKYVCMIGVMLSYFCVFCSKIVYCLFS